ncbi:MAG TPA: cellulase family glycosylhydrolase [Solimonas sp.]|nr:cellulase family glycosylhydrolase [Solimonas sp.]
MEVRGLRALPLLAALLAAACSGSSSPGAAGSVPLACSSAPAQVPAGLKVQLRREGRWMVDPLGRVVLTHGVNAVWKIPPYYPPATPEGFIGADAAWLADNGFNSARIGTLFAGVMPQPDQIDAQYLEAWDRVVQLLSAHGIYTLFDFHQDLYSERFAGEGFPEWATNDDGIPMPVSFGFPGNYFTPACSRAFDNFWSDTDGLWARYRSAWKAVATRWHDQDHHLGYDLINEPWPGTDFATCANPLGCPLHDTQELQALQQEALAGIREADPANLVWFEPNVIFNSGAKTNLALLAPIGDPNIGLSWHKYCLPAALLHAQGFEDVPACDVYHQLVSDNAEEAIGRMQATTLVTEFGASDDLADLVQVTQQTDAQLTGWQYWHYKEWRDPTTESGGSGGQGLFADDADLSTVKVEKLKVLSRTYPQATAGIPLELSFDPDSAEFHYRYQPRAAQGPTEIFVPAALHYPQGYTVEVTGACLVPTGDPRRVLLQNEAGATEVVVTIRRR